MSSSKSERSGLGEPSSTAARRRAPLHVVDGVDRIAPALRFRRDHRLRRTLAAALAVLSTAALILQPRDLWVYSVKSVGFDLTGFKGDVSLVLDWRLITPWLVSLGVAFLLGMTPRYRVLYLRRFGDQSRDAGALQKLLLSRGLKHTRIFTLDDESLAPQALSGANKLFLRLSMLPITAVFFLIYQQTHPEFTPPPLTDVVRAVTQEYERSGSFDEAFSQLVMGVTDRTVATFIGDVCLVLGIASSILYVLLILLTVILGIRSRRRIGSDADLERCARSVSAMGRFIVRPAIAAPRFSVIDVAEDMWRKVVARLAEVCDVVLIDVSKSGPSLLWEIQEMQSRFPDKCVFVTRTKQVEDATRRALRERAVVDYWPLGTADRPQEQPLVASIDNVLASDLRRMPPLRRGSIFEWAAPTLAVLTLCRAIYNVPAVVGRLASIPGIQSWAVALVVLAPVTWIVVLSISRYLAYAFPLNANRSRRAFGACVLLFGVLLFPAWFLGSLYVGLQMSLPEAALCVALALAIGRHGVLHLRFRGGLPEGSLVYLHRTSAATDEIAMVTILSGVPRGKRGVFVVDHVEPNMRITIALLFPGLCAMVSPWSVPVFLCVRDEPEAERRGFRTAGMAAAVVSTRDASTALPTNRRKILSDLAGRRALFQLQATDGPPPLDAPPPAGLARSRSLPVRISCRVGFRHAAPRMLFGLCACFGAAACVGRVLQQLAVACFWFGAGVETLRSDPSYLTPIQRSNGFAGALALCWGVALFLRGFLTPWASAADAFRAKRAVLQRSRELTRLCSPEVVHPA